MTHVALFVSALLSTFALGAQSLLVNNGRYVGAFINSFVIGAQNLVIYKLVPNAGSGEVAAYLLGGPIGIVLAMGLLRRYHRKIA